MQDSIPDIVFTPEIKLKVAKEVRDNIEVTPSLQSTYLIVIAVHKDPDKNLITKISCKKGLPLGGYVYDAQNDNYNIECKDYFYLGFIPLSFFARIKNNPHWKMRVPIPDNVIKKYLTQFQKKELKNFRNTFKVDEYDLQFIQMIDANG